MMPPDIPKLKLHLRPAEDGDMAQVQAIYAHHVLNGLASFEETAPSLDEMIDRRRKIVALGLPYLAAENAGDGSGTIIGFAYASAYRPRPAYRYTVENTVYVAPGMEGRGIGKALLAELIRLCTDCGCRQVIAVIGDSDNQASIRLHEALGFVRSGTLRSVGFKFGRWVDSVLMQRSLGDGDTTLPS